MPMPINIPTPTSHCSTYRCEEPDKSSIPYPPWNAQLKDEDGNATELGEELVIRLLDHLRYIHWERETIHKARIFTAVALGVIALSVAVITLKFVDLI